jgi:hypothetical protein
MTQEEKQLLLKDLCVRLPYGVKILDIPANVVGDLFLVSTTDTVEYEPADETNNDNWTQTLYNIKPYLRPMDSMTEEEKEELYQKTGFRIDDCILGISAIDWLNEHHFDYRGLIEKWLALEAPEGMYK